MLEATESTEGEATQAGEVEVAPGQWYHAEGVAGEGETPDWFIGSKYNTVEDQAKALKAMQPDYNRLKNSQAGAPEAYEVAMPEGVEGEVDMNDPNLGKLVEWGQKNGVSQEGFQEVYDIYGAIQAQSATEAAEFKEAQFQALGPQAQQRITDVNHWIEANLSQEDVDALQGNAISSAAELKAIESMISKTKYQQVPRNDGAGLEPMTVDQINAKYLVNDQYGQPKMRDPKWEAEYDRALAQVVG